MHVLTTFLALLSCALIGTGVWLVLRDVRRAAPREAVQTPPGGVTAIAMPGPMLGAPDDRSPAPAADIEANPMSGPEPAPLFDAGIQERDRVQASLVSALRAVNGAFAPAGIALVREATPLAEPASLAVALMAHGRAAGTLHVAMAGDAIEITASSAPGAAEDVRRFRALKGAEATIPAMAEAIAACAWPVVTAALARHAASR